MMGGPANYLISRLILAHPNDGAIEGKSGVSLATTYRLDNFGRRSRRDETALSRLPARC
jgi:hypothetical protein